MLAVNHAALNRSIAHDGNREELVALFEKLYAREAVTVGVIGASVAQNAGCLDQPRRRCMHFNGRHPTRMSWGTPRMRPFKGFAVRFLDHINASWPHVSHRINNSGVDKTPISSMLTCLMTNLPLHLDIVLVEFNSMARWTDPPSIESLVRQLASLRPRPAIAVVSVHSWCRATFVKRVEDEADRVCKHYNISCLSQRRALEPLVSAGILTKEQLVGKDCIHPINGPLGVDTVAAIIHHWFDRAHTAYKSRVSWSSSESQDRALPQPIWPANSDANLQNHGRRCFAFGTPDQRWSVRFTQQLAPVKWRTTWCPSAQRPWVTQASSASQGVVTGRKGVCYADAHVPSAPSVETAKRLTCPEKIVRSGGRDYAAFLANPPRGFFYCLLELKTNGQGTNRESFGVLAIVPGATLHFETQERPPFVAQLAYLTSYGGMGMAALNCVGQCACSEQLIDAHDTSGANATVFATLTLNVSLNANLDAGVPGPCGMQLQVLNRTSSGGFKFKVRHLIVGRQRQ